MFCSGERENAIRRHLLSSNCGGGTTRLQVNVPEMKKTQPLAIQKQNRRTRTQQPTTESEETEEEESGDTDGSGDEAEEEEETTD